jgi:hypothetical protein
VWNFSLVVFLLELSRGGVTLKVSFEIIMVFGNSLLVTLNRLDRSEYMS